MNPADLSNMMDKAQATQMKIMQLTQEHKTEMASIKAAQNAFKDIRN